MRKPVYLIRNIITGEVQGPYSERQLPSALWSKTKVEWTIFKQLQGETQVILNRLHKRRHRSGPVPSTVEE